VTDLITALDTRDIPALRASLAEHSEAELADEMVRLDPVQQALVFRLLTKGHALGVFEKLEPVQQAELLEALRADETARIIEEIDPDDRARLLDEMPAGVATRLLERVSPGERRRTTVLLGYAPESAGRIMTPEYVSVRASTTAGRAIERIRRAGIDAETIYVVYVVDDTRRLVGVVSLKDLVLAEPDTPVAELMATDIVTATTDEDQEDVARRLADNDFLAIPVVDREQRLVGIVTVDDALDILEREDTEDVERIGGAAPLDRPYLAAGVLTVFRARIWWLFVLFVGLLFTSTVLRAFESSLEAVVALTFFIPLLIGTGGNAGSQTATTIIRAMAIGEVRLSDIARVVWKEMRVGLLLGGAMASLGVLLAIPLGRGADLAVVVGLAITSVVMLATFVGSILPLTLKRGGLDPAVVSAPFIATFVDGTGLLLYFTYAHLIMGI